MPVGALGMAAIGLGADAVRTGMGLALEGHNDRRQLRQQGKLQQQQIAGQMEIGKFNYEQQMKLWNATGYGAQMGQMKAAGINPALMYGMGGGGGQSSAAQSGNVGGAQAPSGGGEIMGLMHGNMLQSAMTAAQIENIKADTKKKEVETTKTGGVDTENVQANTVMTKVQTSLRELDLDMSNDSYKARLARIKLETEEALQEVNILRNDAIVSDNTVMDKIAIIGAELIGLQVRNELSKAQTNKVWSDIKVNTAQIQNWLTQNAQGWASLDLKQREVKITELLGEFNTSLTREAFGAIGGIISTVIGRGMTKGVKISNTKHEHGDRYVEIRNPK